MSTHVAKPIEVDAFQYGYEAQPLWYITAVRKRQVKVNPQKGLIVAKTESGKINVYDPKVFGAMFEPLKEAKDLDGDGIVDAREQAIATETKKRKRRTKKEIEADKAKEDS